MQWCVSLLIIYVINVFHFVTSWQIDGKTMETVTDFRGSKITANGDYSHEIKRHLLLGRKAMTNLDRILKHRDITLPTNVCLVKAVVFPVVMYVCESWTRKKAEHWRIDVFEMWYWRRLLRVPWTARKSNQSILKKISTEYSLEGLMLNLKLQYFDHLMGSDSLGKTLMLVKIEGRRRRGWQRRRWFCFRKRYPFQGPKLSSYLILGNELSKETQVLTKQEILLGKGTRVESSRVREPRRTALSCGLQSLGLWWWD